MRSIAGLVIMSFLTFVSCKQEVKNTDAETAVEAVKEEVKEAVEEVAEVAKTQTISLEQVKGEFTQKELTLKEGTYVFEIANNGVDHEVGFVLAPKGKTDQANHIKEAYVKAPVATGSTSKTNEVTKYCIQKGSNSKLLPFFINSL